MKNDKTYGRVRELETIVEREQDRMFRFAYMRVGNRADAEDIVQDVFLKLFRSGENLAHVRNLQHYLLRSITNSCRDYLRKKRSFLPFYFRIIGFQSLCTVRNTACPGSGEAFDCLCLPERSITKVSTPSEAVSSIITVGITCHGARRQLRAYSFVL